MARSAWHDFLQARRGLFLYDILFKLLEAWVFVPAVALLLSAVLSGAGHIAVSNRDILDFVLAPFGVLYVALFGTVAVALLLLEQAGVMILVSLAESVERPPFKQVLAASFRQALRVVQLGAVQLVLLALAFAPFVLLAVLTYEIFLTQYDINF